MNFYFLINTSVNQIHGELPWKKKVKIPFSEYMNKSVQSTITEKLELTSDFVWTTWKF